MLWDQTMLLSPRDKNKLNEQLPLHRPDVGVTVPSVFRIRLSTFCILKFVFPVNLSVITYGLQIGWISPVVKLLQSDKSPTGRPLTDNEISWIASLPPLLSTFCASPYSWVVDRYGRRFGIMTIGVAQAVSFLLIVSITN